MDVVRPIQPNPTLCVPRTVSAKDVSLPCGTQLSVRLNARARAATQLGRPNRSPARRISLKIDFFYFLEPSSDAMFG